PLAFIAQTNAVMTKQLDDLHEQVTQETHVLRLVAGSATFASLGLSVLYILWTIRAGYLLASVLSTMPAWTFVDPLPILEHFGDGGEGDESDATRQRRKKDNDDGESLETLAKGQQFNRDRKSTRLNSSH